MNDKKIHNFAYPLHFLPYFTSWFIQYKTYVLNFCADYYFMLNVLGSILSKIFNTIQIFTIITYEINERRLFEKMINS